MLLGPRRYGSRKERGQARALGHVAVQAIPGIGPILGAVLVAEIGDIHRFHARDADLLGRDDPVAP